MDINDKIIMNDSFSKHDSFDLSGIRGEVIIGRGRYTEQYINPYGEVAYRSKFKEVLFKEKNIVPIGAYQFAFSKLFNIPLDERSTLRVGDLNEESPQMKIGVPKTQYESVKYNSETNMDMSVSLNSGVNISAMNYIFGFMIGDGGAREDNITAIAPEYKRRQPFHPIPFRMSNDGTKLPLDTYFGKRKDSAGIESYFVKRFDLPEPHIVHCWVTDNKDEFEPVDDTVFSSTSSIPIESYVEMCISVDKYDTRGYFTSSGTTPRVNEFALVSGWYNGKYQDYESIRIFTHFTRPSIVLVENDSIDAIYRLYSR